MVRSKLPGLVALVVGLACFSLNIQGAQRDRRSPPASDSRREADSSRASRRRRITSEARLRRKSGETGKAELVTMQGSRF